MQKLLIFFLFICTSNIVAQNGKQKITITDFKYMNNLKVSNNRILTSGTTYEVENYDGYSNYAYLLCYDLNSKLKWRLKIDSAKTSEVRETEVIDGKVYALVLSGESTKNALNMELFLYTISLEKGTILDKTKIDNLASYSMTNIIKKENKLYFSFLKLGDMFYSSPTKGVLAEYDLKTKKVNKWDSNNASVYPEKIIAKGSYVTSIGVVSVISGLSIVTKQIAILSIKEKQLQLTENILTTESNNQICNAYIEGETLSIASIFHGTYKEPEGYLKFYSVKEDGSFEERRKYFSEYGWKDVSVDFYPQGRATWLKVDYTNDSSYFVKVDETGKILSRIPIKEAIGAAHFAILDSSQIISYNDSIVIAKEKPQNEE